MDESSMMHGTAWSGQKDLTGWYAGEKLHGCRAFWDGFQMWSRGGHEINLPHRLRAGLPTGVALDGEIFAGREPDAWSLAVEAVKHDRWDARCVFKVFDSPTCDADWPQRLEHARQHIGLHAYVQVIPAVPLTSLRQLAGLLDHVRGLNGEGLMAHAPGSRYSAGRKVTLMKVKRIPAHLRP